MFDAELQRGRLVLAGCRLDWHAPSGPPGEAAARRFVTACAANLVGAEPGPTGTNAVASNAASLRIELVTAPPEAPADAATIVPGTRPEVLKAPNGTVLIRFDDCRVLVLPGQEHALFWTAERFAALSHKEQQVRLCLLLVWLLQSRGLTPMHGAALAHEGRAWLLTAASGAGKSTTAFTLCRAGWPLLADDITLLDCRDPLAPRAWPLARGLSAAVALADASGWPRLEDAVVNGKRLLEPPAGMHAGSLPLAGFLVPRVERELPTVLLRLRGAEALAALLPGVGGAFTGLPSAAGRLRELAQVCARLPCYHLRLGTDVYGDPAALTAALLPTLGTAAA